MMIDDLNIELGLERQGMAVTMVRGGKFGFLWADRPRLHRRWRGPMYVRQKHLYLQLMRDFGCEASSTWGDTRSVMLVMGWDAVRRGRNWMK